MTGAASGIGAATALRFAARGMHVIGFDVDAAGLAATREAIERAGGTATAEVVDVGDGEAVRRAVAALGDAHGRLDAVVN
ncbi:SDR family NAD(P)-dependent oxidoreductase, partial [Acrocarpospora catenulata]|uniref:SDR family NAD(P)-dependent oxidoreductase n=1 Tax=Acrocarpospora catenulata TaxID=2836182 RepID=UPI001BD98430